MGKFKNFIEEQKTDLRALVYNYTFTIIAVALLSIVFCIDFEMDKTTDFVRNTEFFLTIFAVGTLFIETFFVDKNQPKSWSKLAIYYVIDAFVSAIWTILGHFDEELASQFDYPDLFYLNISKILVVYIAALVIATIYKLVKLSGLSFDTYISRAIFGLLKMWGLFFVLYLAICLLLSIFDALIMDIDYWDILDNLTVLICGFICFPYSLLTITDTKDENSKFTKGLINVVLMPAVLIALLIVYLYIIKIIVSWDMPSNEVFDICLLVFVLGGPVWFMSYGFLREKAAMKGEPLGLYGKIVKNVKYAYIPLIVLEIVSIGIRIFNYGLTTDRYIAIIVIVFQITYVLWDVIAKLFKKELKEELLLIVGFGIFTFAMLCPGLNMDKLPAQIQIGRFEEALDREDYATAAVIYDYLDSYDCDYGEVYLDDKFTKQERDELEVLFFDYVDQQDEYKYTEYVRAYVPTDIRNRGVEVAGFTHIYDFYYYGDYNKVYSEEELKCITITYSDAFEVNVDVTQVVDLAIELKEDDLNYSQDMEYQYLKLSNNCSVVIDNISFRYNTYTGEISGLDLEGHVLTNEGGHNGQ